MARTTKIEKRNVRHEGGEKVCIFRKKVPIVISGQQVCCINFGETSSGPVFGNEIEKKRFLDMLLNAIQDLKINVYAYCVLDYEAYILATADGRKKIRLAMQKTKQQFQEHYRKRFPESKEKFQIEYEWLKGYDMKQIMQLGIAFHFLPVRYNYVQMPEDYWWTSLKEYELRYRSGIIRPEIFLTKLAGSQKQALRKIKALHRQAQQEGERLYRDVSIYKNVSEKKK